MALALVVFGLLMASLPALCRRGGRQLRPNEWARLSAGGLMGGVVVVEVGLILLAVPTALRAAGVEALAAACGRVVAPLIPFGEIGGWVSAGLALLTAAQAIRELRRVRRARAVAWVEPCIGERVDDGSGIEIVVVPGDAMLAYSVSYPSPQIVLSSRLVTALNADELDVVVAHERAHVRLGHHRTLSTAAVATAALGWWPAASRSCRVVSTAHERWADDVATGHDVERRRRLGRVLEHVALDRVALPAVPFSPAHAIAERIAALAASVSPRSSSPLTALRVALYIPGGFAAAGAVGVFSVWVTQAQFVLALAGRCPLQA